MSDPTPEPSISIPALVRRVKACALAAALAAGTWAAVEVALTERRARDAFLDQGGAIRSVACSADGRTIYISAATGVIGSADGGASWTQCFPPPSPPQQVAAPVASHPTEPAHGSPSNTEPRTAGGR